MSQSVFEPMPPLERAAFKERYLEHLRRRNGEPDRAHRRFSVREAFFKEIDEHPVRRTGPPVVDQAAFDRYQALHHPAAGLDAAMLWALAVAKSNRSERYGVEYGLEHSQRGLNTSDPMAYIEIEEFYHTRILEDVVHTLGVDMKMMDPHPLTAFFVRLMVVLPEPLANVLIFCGELAGVAVFRLLLEKARELFADQPEPLRRMETLFRQIIVDEVGHVHNVRSLLGPLRLRFAKLILPAFTYYFLSDIPELTLLFGRERLMSTILAGEVDKAAQDYPERLPVAA